MKLRDLRWVLFIPLICGILSCSQKEVTLGDLEVIPLPNEVSQVNDGTSFVIDESTTICYPEGNEKMKRNAEFLAAYIKQVAATEVRLSADAKGGDNTIVLSLDNTLSNDEGYELSVSKEQISLKGKTEAGVFYGIQTLHKALPVTDGTTLAAIPCGSVKDYPRFGYRGFMVDVGRHFFSVDYLKEIIDMLALHNINYFHWHLTEDQGWRIEIKKYPKLTEIGSKRKCTIKDWETKELDSIPVSGYYTQEEAKEIWRIEIKKYPKLTEIGSKRKCTIKDWETKELDSIPVSGYYTQEEAKEIVRYAAERYITVIPEIDMPGHMLAALASYPELGCTGGPYEVATTFGVFRNVLCGGNEKTLQFAKDVINEIMDIFPSPYIHIGGDECPKYHWKTCAKCQKKIRELGLKTSKEHTKENQLQAWFMGEVEKEIRKRGREMMAWDEILAGNPAKSTIVMAWTTPEARLKSIESGYRTIACPISNLYFSNPKYNKLKGLSSIERVYSFEPVPEEATSEQKKNLLTIACPISNLYFSNPKYNKLKGLSSIERVYSFEPVPEEATSEQKKNLFGAQACIWTEWTKDSVKMEWQMMPRIAALAEIQWTEPANKNIQDFLKRFIWTEWTKDSVKMEWQMMPRIAALAEIQWTEPANKNIQDFLKRLKHQLDIYELYGYNYKEDIHEALDK